MGEYVFDDRFSLQDRDLFLRLTYYFENFETRLRLGEGWLIFNAAGERSGRITRFLLHNLQMQPPRMSYQFLPWRDFALTAYMVEVELPGTEFTDGDLSGRAKREFDIATRISHQTMARLVTADLLVVSGLKPAHTYEVDYLDATIERRYRQRLSTIIITPGQPHELADAISKHSPQGVDAWDRISNRMYETSLVAV